MVTKEQQLAEAIERMKALKLHKNTIADLKQGRVNVSKQRGALYWANEEEKEIIAKFRSRAQCTCISRHLYPDTFRVLLFYAVCKSV